MEHKDLTGIERELVLQYLIDGNVPVTVIPIEKKSSAQNETVSPLPFAVFPVALKGEQVTVLNQGIILLKNPSDAVSKFSGKMVRVEFYFNRVGLFFVTEMREIKAGLALVIPEAISRIKESRVQKEYDFSATIYYSCSNKATVNFSCIPCAGFQLFTKPVWSSIDLENQKKAKNYLEAFVIQAKKEGGMQNGIFLIPICKYLTESEERITSFSGAAKPLSILYVDHERMVIGSENENFSLSEGAEYALKLSFVLATSKITRDVFATCIPKRIYRSLDGNRSVADCVYTSLKEEDARFLYEKATKKIFV